MPSPLGLWNALVSVGLAVTLAMVSIFGPCDGKNRRLNAKRKEDAKARASRDRAADEAACQTRGHSIVTTGDKKIKGGATTEVDGASAYDASNVHPYESALGMAAAIKAGKVTSRSLVEQSIRRIQALDGPLNAVILRSFESARARADEADAAMRAGECWGALPCQSVHTCTWSAAEWPERLA